jgi:hypothetical protein
MMLSYIMVIDKTLPTDLRERSSSGQFLKVPLLTGGNAHEGDFYGIAQAIDGTLDLETFPAVSDELAKVRRSFSCITVTGVCVLTEMSEGLRLWGESHRMA